MVDDDVAELVVGGLVVGRRDGRRDLGVGAAAVVGTQHVDVAGRDVVVGQERGVGAVRGDPLAVVGRYPCLGRRLGERVAVVVGHGDVDRGEVEAGDVQPVGTGRGLDR